MPLLASYDVVARKAPEKLLPWLKIPLSLALNQLPHYCKQIAPPPVYSPFEAGGVPPPEPSHVASAPAKPESK